MISITAFVAKVTTESIRAAAHNPEVRRIWAEALGMTLHRLEELLRKDGINIPTGAHR